MGGGTTAETPDLEEIARRAREKYPEYDVGVVFGVLLRAVRKGTQTPVPVEAATEELLLDGIARQARMRHLAVQRARRNPVAACGAAASQ